MGDLRSHAILLRYSLLIINVDFCKGNTLWLRMFRRETFVERRDLLAWSTPICIDWPQICISKQTLIEVERLTVCNDNSGGAESSAKLRGGGDIDR